MEDRFVRGLAFHRQGMLHQAQALYLQILPEFPQHADTQHLLGLLRRQQGRPAEAVALLREAVDGKPDEAVFHSNLGNALRDLGDFPQAAQAYREAIRREPGFVQAHNNLGVLLLRQRRPREAIACLDKALELAPEFVDAINNLGFARKELGQFDVATACYARALALQPTHQDALYNLGNCAIYAGDLDAALAHFRKAEEVGPATASGRASVVRQALIHYLMERPRSARGDLARVAASPGAGQSFNYQRYLANLLAWHNAAPPQTSATGKLHAIGESHVLSVHGTVLDVQGVAMRCQGWWIEGCKQWHLANDQPNRFKAQFSHTLQRLPPGSWVLLAIGEIDCRHDEGILAAWRKSGEPTFARMIVDTVQGYVRHASRAAASQGHKLVFSGVPASNFPADRMHADDRPALAQLIAEFNGVLEKVPWLKGIDFLTCFH